jgi:hypothetical protein
MRRISYRELTPLLPITIPNQPTPSAPSRQPATHRSFAIDLGDLIISGPLGAHGAPKVVSALLLAPQALLLELLNLPAPFRHLLRRVRLEPRNLTAKVVSERAQWQLEARADRPPADLEEPLEAPVEGRY